MIEQAMADAGADAGDDDHDRRHQLRHGDGAAAGVTAIGVAWGYHEAEELLAAGADFIAATPVGDPEFVKALHA
jgi:phosphoglycolate phosphatase